MLHPGDVFTDKDRKYQVIAVAYHAKSNEKMIVYQQLFDNFKILTDTFDDFFNQPEADVHIEIPADDRKDNDADTKQIQLLHKRIHRLRPFDRAIVLLWLEGLPYDEIGAITGITAKNVSVRLSRIREELKKMND